VYDAELNLTEGLEDPRNKVIAGIWEEKLNSLNREYLECVNARVQPKDNSSSAPSTEQQQQQQQQQQQTEGQNETKIIAPKTIDSKSSDQTQIASRNDSVEDVDARAQGYGMLSSQFPDSDDDSNNDDEDAYPDTGYAQLQGNMDGENGDEGAELEGNQAGTLETKETNNNDAADATAQIFSNDKASKIQSIMGELDLPAPEWAKNVPEDVWMKTLLSGAQIDQQKECK